MSHPATATFAEFADIARVKRSYVTQLRKDGRLVLEDGGQRLKVAESLARIAETKDPSKAGVAARHEATRAPSAAAEAPPADSTADSSPYAGGRVPDQSMSDRAGSTYQASRAVREKFLAMEAKRAYEVAIGKLMEVSEVTAAVADAITTLRMRFEAMPDILGPQCAAVTDEGKVREIIADAVHHALEETARKFGTIAKRSQP